MTVNMFGNIDGKSYQPHTIDLFEMADKQRAWPETVKQTQLKDATPVRVSISKEGLQALHGSRLKGSIDLRESQEQIAYWSEHQPIESFHSRLSRAMQSVYEKDGGEAVRHSLQEKADALLDGFEKLYQEISRGYEEGTRVRYIEDASAEDGFRKLTKEEELDILQREWNEFVDSRFGPERQKQSVDVTKALNDFQKVKQQIGRGDVRMVHYEPEIIPEGFAEQIKRTARNLIK